MGINLASLIDSPTPWFFSCLRCEKPAFDPFLRSPKKSPPCGLPGGHVFELKFVSCDGKDFFRTLFSPNAHNLNMPPERTIRRLKTYTSTQGYVYQYYFVGQRPALVDDPEAPAIEFIFDVTSDRKLTYAVSIFLPQNALQAWDRTHGRSLTDAEQYAAAKLRLFRAFDELDDVKDKGRRLRIDAKALAESLATLGVE
jgi:hypothetical protein